MMTAEQLKASILQMAMQGKLVEQRAEEGTGEELLKTITKKFDTPKSFSINEEEITFEIPESWAWTKVGNVTILYNGRAFKPSDWTEDGLPIVRIQNLNDENAPFNRYNGVFDEEYHLYGEELLFAWSGTPGTSFGAHIWKRQEAVLNQHIFRIEFPEKYINKKYFAYALNFQVLNLIRLAHGSAGLQHVTKGNFQNTLIPLPPLEEQKRIVAKIEELMPFVEQYAKTSTRLNTLNASFPDRMKKSILQQAVMGKLVPQDPKDEPASVLLKKIAEEKLKLIKEGKIKKLKALPAITEDEIPFDIPESWEWVQLDELAIFENGDRGKNYPNKSEYVQSGVAWINTSHIKPNGYLTTTEMNYITREKFETLRSGKIKENDLVFCLRGATYGKVSRVEPYTEGAVASSLMIIRPIISILRDYLLLYLKTPLAFSELAKYANGSAQPNLGAKDVRKYLVPLPPLKEQNRILECVEEILPKLDDLRK